MKKITFIFLLLLFATLVFAQTSPTKHGVSTSLNIANWTGSDAEEMASVFGTAFREMGMSGGSFSKESRLGFSFGYFIQYRITDLFIIQPEFNYTMKGSGYSGSPSFQDEYSGSYYNFDTKIIYKLNYLEIPILLKMKKISQIYSPQFVVFGGLVISFLHSSKIMVKVSFEDESDQEEEDFDEFESTEIGYIVGAGIEFPSGITADVRYNRGVGSVMEDGEIFNSVIMIKLGFLF